MLQIEIQYTLFRRVYSNALTGVTWHALLPSECAIGSRMYDRVPTTIRLPWALQRRLEAASSHLLRPVSGPPIDFAGPAGEPALTSPHSVSWRVFKNPIALFVGGVAAVILELADPSVRSGVWDHSTFRNDPLRRLRRTGLAAMVTVYGARSLAEPMIERVVRMHAKVSGLTTSGEPYSASDPALLTWVHVTAAYGFACAYGRYVEPLGVAEMDALYREGAVAAALYGAPDPPTSEAAVQALFDSMRGRLARTEVIFSFLDIMRKTPTLPSFLAWLQPLLVRAAVDVIPHWVRERLGLTEDLGLRRCDGWLVRTTGAVANRIILPDSPAVQSCLRVGLPINHLYS